MYGELVGFEPTSVSLIGKCSIQLSYILNPVRVLLFITNRVVIKSIYSYFFIVDLIFNCLYSTSNIDRV